HGLPRSPFRNMALSSRGFEGLLESDKKLRGMRFWCHGVLIVAFALAVWSASHAAAADPFDTVHASYVSAATAPTAATITVQLDDHLMVYSMTPDAVVRERSGDVPWQTVALSRLVAGEPITMHLNGAGYVSAVDAEYTTVTTRLITAHNGYLVTTNGQAYRLAGAAAQVQPLWQLGTFLRLRVDPQSGEAFDVSASSQPFSGGPLAQLIHVTFVVTVPPRTPSRDVVYMATDASSWVPNGVRMSPVSGNRWTVTLNLGKGSSIKYKYTRGSWETAETNQSGMEIPNRSLTITQTQDEQRVDDVVVRWLDLPS
ncbi:MAG TPA: CBM20 domain-containing protein, partial [Xanthobacteraceae bacterium]